MAGATHPTDVLVADLADLYARNHARLEAIVAAGLRRGLDPTRLGQPDQRRGDSTLAYRQRQAEQARAILDELGRQARTASPLIIGRAYRSGLVSVDAAVGDLGGRPTGVEGAFGRVHARAVESLAGNLTRSLTAATERVGSNIGQLFDLADSLEGALPARGGVAGVPFLGRRVNDAFRALSVDTVAGGIIGLDTRRQVSTMLARRLVTEGVTTALAGFVDRAGRRWPLPAYARMVARTTTREAMSAATTNRLREHGRDLVAISSHAHAADECDAYDGRTFSLDGATPGYDVLDELPPFHPNCAHVIGPASADLDAFEEELGLNAAGVPRVTAPPRAPAPAPPHAGPIPPRPPAPRPGPSDADRFAQDEARPPFGNAPPVSAESSPAREAAQERAYKFTDPGPEPGAHDAWVDYVTKQEKQANRELNRTLGDDLAKYIDRQWGRDAGIRGKLLNGELTIEEATDIAYAQYQADEHRKLGRELDRRAYEDGYKTGSTPCFSCGHFKRRPADVCTVCGDDPVPLGYSADEFNRAYGYAPEGFGRKSHATEGDDLRSGKLGEH